MENIISWTNLNSATILVLLTGVYVITTIVLLIYNHKAVKEMKLSRIQMASGQPAISLEVRRKGLICFVVKNYGSVPVTKFKMEFSKNWLDILPEDRRKVFEKLKSVSLTLAPSQELIFLIAGSDKYQNFKKEKLEVILTYSDINKNNNTDKIEFDFESYEYTLLYGPQIDELTGTIKSEFENLNRNFKELIKTAKDNELL